MADKTNLSSSTECRCYCHCTGTDACRYQQKGHTYTNCVHCQPDTDTQRDDSKQEQEIRDDLFADLTRFKSEQIGVYDLMEKILSCTKLKRYFQGKVPQGDDSKKVQDKSNTGASEPDEQIQTKGESNHHEKDRYKDDSMKEQKLLKQVKDWPTKDAIEGILGGLSDYGSSNGAMLSVKQYPKAADLILALLSQNSKTLERVREKLQKDLKQGNPIERGKGDCKCTPIGKCLRCASNELHAHRKGEIKGLTKVLAILEAEKGQK